MENQRFFTKKKIFYIYYFLTLITFFYFSKIRYKMIPDSQYSTYIEYSIAIFIIFIFMAIFGKNADFPVEFFGLEIEKISGKFILWVIITAIFFNLFLLFTSTSEKIEFNHSHALLYSILARFFFRAIRILGEEIIFRGFLLSKNIMENNEIFWILNIVQAIVFTSIHMLIPFGSIMTKILMGVFIFFFSIFGAFLNKKFKSIMPSWFLHTLNGVYIYFI